MIDERTVHYPQSIFAVAVNFHGELVENASQDVILAIRNHRLHGLQIKHFGVLIKTYPQPMKLILHNVMTGVTAQRHAIIAHTKVAIGIAIIANKAATMRGYPHETIAVCIDIINKITGKSTRHVQIRRITLHDISRLCPCREADKTKKKQ